MSEIPPSLPWTSPSRPRRRYWLHLLLFLLTVFTTLVVGARLEANFRSGQPAFATEADFFPLRWGLHQPSRLLMGIPFSLALLGILLAHEMGHFIYCVRNRVYATLPFFIPAPTLIGTLGAFIRIRSPIRSRDALFKIGIAGPLAGFMVAVPVLFYGLLLSKPFPRGASESAVDLGFPLIFHLLRLLAGGEGAGGVPLDKLYLHPIAVAAWVGMFATELNLLPGGQLDGGHIVYALWPRAHRYVSGATVLLLVPMGVIFWPGWLVWSLLLTLTGLRHPQVPSSPELAPGSRLAAVLAALLLLLTFLPDPFPGASLLELLRQ